jgi:putative phosphoesterase
MKYLNLRMKIGLISDTHGWIHPRLFELFAGCDEIWHAGDIGNIGTADSLSAFKPLRAVYGNIDNNLVRVVYPETLRFKIDEVDVWMTHIGGFPGKYDMAVKPGIFTNPPGLFISGHSHILKIIFDQKLNLLHINPGAAGNYGLQKVCTAVRFAVEGKEIKELEIWEFQREK